MSTRYPLWQARLFAPEDLSGGTGGGTPSAELPGGTPNPTDFFEGLQLDAEDREWSTKAGIKDARSLFDFARDRHREIGHRPFRRPADDASDEDKADYRSSLLKELGTPDKAESYELAPPADMPEHVPYDSELGDWFRQAAFDSGLPADSAQTLHDKFVGRMIEQAGGNLEAVQAEATKIVADATAELETSFGAKHGTPEYDAQTEIGFRAIKHFGGDKLIEELVKAGDFLPDPAKEGQYLVTRAALLSTFATMGKELLASGGLPEGDPAVSGNPFADGKDLNLTKQSEIIQRSKPEAVSLIRRAGKQPENWGL